MWRWSVARNPSTRLMLSFYSSWAEQVRRGYRSGFEASDSLEEPIVFCGMGGSGIVGSFVSRSLESLGVESLSVIHHMIPSWLRRGSLIAISYSGDTVETLNCVYEALDRGLRVILVSSGGLMREMASSRGIRHVQLTPGGKPRAMLAEMVGAVVGVVSRGLGVSLVDVEGLSKTLKGVTLERAKPYYSLALSSQVLVVSYCEEYSPLVNRWKSEFSENAKMIVKGEVYPESGHNDIVAWQADHKVRVGFIVIAPRRGECRGLLSPLVDVYSRVGRLEILELGAENLLSSYLEGSLVAGYASVIAAELRGVDPASTDIISEYKSRIAGIILRKDD